jgi:hypothetical protein
MRYIINPLLACGEGVGGGVLVSYSTENRYNIEIKTVVGAALNYQGKNQKTIRKKAEWLKISLNSTHNHRSLVQRQKLRKTLSSSNYKNC